ncbi:MAG: hypothetical protein V4615_04415 [Bacteroidota bacterium]
MKKISLLLSLLVSSFAFSQTNIEDVVYLKSGSIVRGKITEHKYGVVKIELTGGSLFVFQPGEIDSVKKENVVKRNIKAIRKNYFRKDRGYRNMTEFGIIYGTDLKRDNNDPYYYYYNNNPDDFGLSLHTVNGYQVWPYLYAGAGIGVERFISLKQTFSPFYLRVASEFLKKRVTPYAFLDVGYSHLWKQKSNEYISYQNKGGLYLTAGGGVRIYTQSRASVVLSLAYKRNQSESKWWYTQSVDGSFYTIKRTYQRLVMSVGVTF